MSRSRRLIFFLLFTGSFIVGCGEATGPETIDRVLITTIDGDSLPSVARGGTIQLQAKAFRRGTEVHGLQFEWGIQDSAVASVDSIGRLSGIAYGRTQVTARAIGRTGAVGAVDVDVLPVAIATLDISLPGGFVDLAHAVQLAVVARDSAGLLIAEPDLSWSAVPPNVEIDGDGRVTGLVPGNVVITAEAWSGVSASAQVRVTPVSAFSTDTVYFGSAIEILGQALPAGAKLFFTGEGGSLVEAFVHSATEARFQAWVPARAASGPVTFVSAQDSFSTSRRFTVPASMDLFENVGNASGSMFGAPAVQLPFPYRNPSLLLRGGLWYHFVFRIEQPTPFAWYLASREADAPSYATGFLIRLEQQDDSFWPDIVPSFLMTYDFIDQVQLDSAVYSRETLSPDWYALVVKMGTVPGQTADSHAYGLRLAGAADFELPPDAYEPNDFPQEAPTVALPFNSDELHAENAWALDHYVVTLQDSALLQVFVQAQRGNPDLMILAGDTLDYYLTPQGQVVAEAFGIGPTEEVQALVGPGTYTIVVQEYGGQATEYQLQIEALPPPQAAVVPVPPALSPQRAAAGPRSLFQPVVRPLSVIPGPLLQR